GARTVAGAIRTPPIAKSDGKSLIISSPFHFSMLETEGAEMASKTTKETGMKLIQAAVLVLVGALGAMLYLKVKSPEPPAPGVEATARQPQPAQAVEVQPVEEPVAPAPVRKEKK